MGKVSLKKILSIAFLAILLFILIKELQNNIVLIKQEFIKGQTEEVSECEVKIKEVNKGITEQNQQEKSIEHWISVERKDSYNNELQYYSKDNVVIDGNAIEIVSKKENKENKIYTSGLVESSCSYKYGYFEFTIEIFEGQGIFPAIWLMPVDGDPFPEIDIFEMIGSEPHTFYGVVHYEENGAYASDYFAHKVSAKDQYIVALNWTDKNLTWYIDNQEVYKTSKGVPQEYMYIIINQAIGGDWPGDPDDEVVFPNKFKIISVRIESSYEKGRY